MDFAAVSEYRSAKLSRASTDNGNHQGPWSNLPFAISERQRELIPCIDPNRSTQ